MLEVDVVAPVKSMSRARVTSGFGSYEMQDLLGKRKAQEAERQDKERESSSKRSDRVTRKANEEAEANSPAGGVGCLTQVLFWITQCLIWLVDFIVMIS